MEQGSGGSFNRSELVERHVGSRCARHFQSPRRYAAVAAFSLRAGQDLPPDAATPKQHLRQREENKRQLVRGKRSRSFVGGRPIRTRGYEVGRGLMLAATGSWAPAVGTHRRRQILCSGHPLKTPKSQLLQGFWTKGFSPRLVRKVNRATSNTWHRSRQRRTRRASHSCFRFVMRGRCYRSARWRLPHRVIGHPVVIRLSPQRHRHFAVVHSQFFALRKAHVQHVDRHRPPRHLRNQQLPG
jgi:hypothetical protein